MRPRPTLVILLAIAACRGESPTTPLPPDPPPLSLLPGTGITAIETDGIWEVAEVEVIEQIGTLSQTNPRPTGFMPPVVGALLRIEGGQLISADERDLRPEACRDAILRRMIHHVDARRVLFYRSCYWPPVPGMADSGAMQRLQFALGSVDNDTLSGLVQHQQWAAFMPRELPRSGLYRVSLRRQIADQQAPR